MKQLSVTKAITLAFVGTLSAAEACASDNLSSLKPGGVSIDLYHQSMDLNIDDIKANIPGVTPEILKTFEPQLNTTNEIDFHGLRLDYQITPTINLFGSVGKAEEKTTVDFSSINPALSDLSLDKKGEIYSVGATYVKDFSPIIASLTMSHSLIDLEDNPHDIKVSGVVPSLGYKTRIGVITGSLIYQEVDAVFAGEITAPVPGPVPSIITIPVEVSASNESDIKLLLGLQTRLARDFYLNASAGIDGNEQYQIQLNKRF